MLRVFVNSTNSTESYFHPILSASVRPWQAGGRNRYLAIYGCNRPLSRPCLASSVCCASSHQIHLMRSSVHVCCTRDGVPASTASLYTRSSFRIFFCFQGYQPTRQVAFSHNHNVDLSLGPRTLCWLSLI